MLNLSVFQVMILATFSALAIAGLLIFALVVGGAGGVGVGPVVIWGTQDAGAFSVVIRQAAENESKLAQVSYVQKDPVTYQNELTEALASGKGPDLFLLRQDHAVKDRGKVYPIPYRLLSRSDFEDIFVEGADPYLAEEGIIGMPLFVDPLIMYWNKDLLESAGFSQPPAYWDEFANIAQKSVKRDASGAITKAAVAFGEYQNVDNAKDIISLLILQAGGSITERDSTGRLDPTLAARTAGPQQAAESALRFYTEFADPSKLHYSWNRAFSSSRAAFLAGDLAIYFGYASEASGLGRANPNLNFAAAPVPQVRSADARKNVARVYALAVSRASKNPQGAMTVATIMADASLSRGLTVALGVPAARRDILSESGDDKNVLFDREAIIARSWIDPDPERTSGIFRAMIESVTSGSARLAEAISRANQEIAEVIGQ